MAILPVESGSRPRFSGIDARQRVNARQRSMHHAVISIAFVGYMYSNSCAHSPSLFPRTFCWHASLDTTTGEATAMESSMIRGLAASGAEVSEIIRTYPVWLAKPLVTFGLLRADLILKSDARLATCRRAARRSRQLPCSTPCSWDRNRDVFAVSVNDAFFRLNLLSFGKPKTYTVHGWSTDTTNDEQKSRSRRRIQRIRVDFPIIGGLLAMTDPGPSTEVKTRRLGTKRSNTNRQHVMEHGCIRFEVLSEKGCSGEWQGSRIESRICCGYHPSLAGKIPIRPARKLLYLSTQSLVHAFVMWRFHRNIVTNLRSRDY